MTPTDCDVVVIGAGISGLMAALTLEADGLSVRVLEAQDRTGGRIQSMQQLGDNAEAGATYIGAGYSRFRHLGIPGNGLPESSGLNDNGSNG